MLNALRLIIVILGGISLIILGLDYYNLFGFKITNKAIEKILYLIFLVCSLLFAIDGFFEWFNNSL